MAIQERGHVTLRDVGVRFLGFWVFKVFLIKPNLKHSALLRFLGFSSKLKLKTEKDG